MKLPRPRPTYLLLLSLPVFALLHRLRARVARARLDCADPLRLGDAYGGWVSCAPLAPLAGRLVYTVGVGRNIEWDKAMIERYGTVHHGWDPTPTAVRFFGERPPPPAFTFHPFGLAAADGNVTLKLPEGNGDSYSVMEYFRDAKPGTVTTVPMLSLPSMLRMLGHASLAILKIDIEGAEFAVIDQWHRSRYAVPADQVLVEFHERYFRAGPQIVHTALTQMRDLGFDPVHHTKLEYTFAKRSLISGLS